MIGWAGNCCNLIGWFSLGGSGSTDRSTELSNRLLRDAAIQSRVSERSHFLIQLDNFLLSEINDAEDDSENISVDNEAKVEVSLV